MQRKKPTLLEEPKARVSPKPSKADTDKSWTFSFRFYRQIEHFGLEGANTDANWFSSLFDRFSDLSQRRLSDFLTDRALQGQQGYRYHPIDWSQKNIPIQRGDLDWVPDEYTENDEEYPIFQFQISKANGRVVGFFDEKWDFNIILLDPLHNIQPSAAYGYKVDPCSPLSCELTNLKLSIENLNHNDCHNDTCGYRHAITNINSEMQLPTNIIMHSIDDDLAVAAQEQIDTGKVNSYTDILETGITYLNE